MSLIKHFPEGYNPRPSQLNVLEKIDRIIEDKNRSGKFVLMQIPTGGGKSHIAATLANYTEPPSKEFIRLVEDKLIFAKNRDGGYVYEEDALDLPIFGCMVLTTTKNLQNQYSNLFENCELLKGRANYVCEINDEFDCEVGPCLLSPKQKRKCEADDLCPYLNARNEMIKSQFSVLNYSMFLSLPDHVKRRSIIICDECSELEDELVKFYSIDIDYKKLKYNGIKINQLTAEEKGREWLVDLWGHVNNELEDLVQTFKQNQNSLKHLTKQLNQFRYLSSIAEKIRISLKHWYPCQYITEFQEGGVAFVPLYVDPLAEFIFQHADLVFLMSATIIDHFEFAKTLGIQKSDYTYFEIESSFDPKKSPIYCPGKLSLNYKNIDKNLPRVVDQAIKICTTCKNHKGIIHTHSFKITEAFKKKLGSNSRFLFREEGITNEKILEEHFARTDNTVLVSPSLGFGTDLIEDQGRFQIIVKLPYLPLGSKRIKTLFDRNKRWYEMKMLIALMQTSGRCTRTQEDYSYTFILDGAAFPLLKKVFRYLPKHFQDRLQ